MKDWIEVFKTGTHQDSKGRKRTWTTDDLDKMVTAYSPADHHEAPVVVGHPKDNHPAYGWVEGLKRDGNKLMAKFKQVAPEFAQLVEEGRYKKRSIRVNPDGTLGHVAFLGAVPPAIKGLKDIEFSADNDSSDYDYMEEDFMDARLKQLEEELAKEKAGRLAAEKQASDFKGVIDKTTADFAESQRQAKRQEVIAFIDQGIKDGKILPAWKEKGIVDFMCSLEEGGGEFEFSEVGETKKESPDKWFRNFISDFAAHPLFKEMVKPEKEDGKTSDFAEEEKLANEMASYVTPQK